MNRISERLTPFQENQLQWLKSQVNKMQDIKYRRAEDGEDKNAGQNLWLAREELSTFVRKLREAGKKV